MAPSGPKVQAHRISESDTRVNDRPTASPRNFGWTSDCSTKLMTEYATMIQIIALSPPVSSPRTAGGASPITKPTLGM
jgi:hypothetical protein